jgi:Tol biopolymer transport system component
MRRPQGFNPVLVRASGLAVLVAFAALVLAACGGSDTTASSSPSAMSLPSATVSPSQTPIPAPTVTGTIAFARVVEPEANYDIFVIDSDGTGLSQLTDDPGVEEGPSWSPDGKRIVYDAGKPSSVFRPSVWVMRADGSGKVRLGRGGAPHWSPDGGQIVYTREMGETRAEDVFVMNADGSGQRCVIDREGSDVQPAWASNGMILFNRNDALFAVNPDGSGLVRLTKVGGVRQCAVSPDGKRIAAFEPVADRVVVVPVQRSGEPVVLLEPVLDFISDGAEAASAWTPDGEALAVASSEWGELLGSRIYIVNADGSGLSAVPHVENALGPAWRPE